MNPSRYIMMRAYFHIIDHEQWPADDKIYINYEIAKACQKGDIIFWPFHDYLLHIEVNERHFDFQRQELAVICTLVEWYNEQGEFNEDVDFTTIGDHFEIMQSKMNDPKYDPDKSDSKK